MANIQKRGVYWRAQVRRKGYPHQSRSFDTRAAAEAWARMVESEMDRGIFVDRTEAERNTVGDLINRYLREVTPTKKGASSEASRLRALCRRRIAKIKISALSGTLVAQYRDERLAQVAPATVNKELNHLSHVIETARREWGVQIPENPVGLVRRPKPAKARDRRLESGEEERLFAAIEEARNPYLKAVVQLAIETAMRQSEIVNLPWKAVDIQRRIAHLSDTKNGESRTVPLSTNAVATLKSLPRSLDGKVFPGLTPEAIKRAFARSVKRAELDDLHFHDLRHEATSRLFEKGLNPMEVASITGHKTLQMLMRYTHLRAEELAKKLG